MENAGGTRTLGPWLLLLCVLLLVWTPVNFALLASTLVETLPIRGFPVAAVLAVRLFVVAMGIGAGLALLAHRPGAVQLAAAALIASAVADIVVYTTPWFPSNRLPGTTPLYVGGSLAYHAAWLIYLFRSKRVREIW